MKTIGAYPIIRHIVVRISDIIYKNEKHTWEFVINNGRVNYGICEEAGVSHAGAGFFEERFGKKQTTKIKELCTKRYKKELAKYINDYRGLTNG